MGNCCGCLFACVEESTIGVVESFGKYVHISPRRAELRSLRHPTLSRECRARSPKPPLFLTVSRFHGRRVTHLLSLLVAAVSLRVQQLDVACETKTKDNVFVTVVVSVQYCVTDATETNIKLAYYKLSNPTAQITSYVFDVIRSEVPKLVLDDTFAQKDELALAVKVSLPGRRPSSERSSLITMHARMCTE
eukprot:scaffold907_cov398-Prasinococcus_capsulatus_cf.AAC.3